MRFGRGTPPALVLALFGSIVAGRASAASPAIVHVDLMDPSSGPSVASMMIKTDQATVKAGPVKFLVSNDSKTLVHEMIVVSVADPNTPLPYDRKHNRVIESKIKDSRRSVRSPAGNEEDADPDVEARQLHLDLQSAGSLQGGHEGEPDRD